MAKEPKISCEDIRLRLNGVYSGSDDNYYFWEESISSGSLWDIISGSDTYLRNLLGDGVMDTTDSNKSRLVKEAELLYSCFRTLVLLSGGVIVSGFSWKAGVSVDMGQMLPAYRNLIEGFKTEAQKIVKSLQDVYYKYDWATPTWSETAPAVM